MIIIDGLLYKPLEVLVRRRDTRGYGKGTSPTPNDIDTSGGVVSLPPLIIRNILSLGEFTITRGRIVSTGGGRVWFALDTGVTDRANVPLVLSRFHTGLNELSNGAAVIDLADANEAARVRAGGSQPDAPELNSLQCAIVCQLADAGTDDPDDDMDAVPGEFALITFTAIEIIEPGSGVNSNEGTDPNVQTYQIVPSANKRSWDGQLYSTYNTLGAIRGDRAARFPYYFSRKPFTENFVMDGTAATVTLTYLPVYEDVTDDGANIIVLNGTRVAAASLDDETGILTLSAAGDDGDILTVTYMHTGILAP